MSARPGRRPGRTQAGIALVLIAVSAIALQRGATAPWAEGTTPDGTRLIVSPIGLVQSSADASVAPIECRWWPRLGNPELCAVVPGGEAAMSRLRRAYPFIVVAMWTAVLALFLNALNIPRRFPWVGATVTVVASAFAAAAVWAVSAASQAFPALSGAALRYNQSGYLSVAGAALLTALATGLLMSSSRRSRNRTVDDQRQPA